MKIYYTELFDGTSDISANLIKDTAYLRNWSQCCTHHYVCSRTTENDQRTT